MCAVHARSPGTLQLRSGRWGSGETERGGTGRVMGGCGDGVGAMGSQRARACYPQPGHVGPHVPLLPSAGHLQARFPPSPSTSVFVSPGPSPKACITESDHGTRSQLL